MLRNFKNLKPSILVVGDLMIDSYFWGSCERISPEAPVQIINVDAQNSKLGGAGNVANNLNSLGAKVSIISVIGDCENSKELRNILKENNISDEFLIEESTRITSKKTRIISENQHVIRFDQESVNDISTNSEELIQEILKSVIDKYEVIVLSDYNKGVLTERVTKNIIKLANNLNIKVLIDPKGSDYSKYKGAYLLTPNKKEASLASGIAINNDSSLNKALLLLKKNCSLGISLITLSEKGIAVNDSETTIHPTVAREVYDVTGAGDTVIASLAFAIANNLDIKSAVEFSNLAAGIVVGKIGSSTTTLEEIFSYESSLHKTSCDEHIKSWEDIRVLVSSYRANKKTIVFTNGCFDILHIGHVKYLEKAKLLGDVLIVGINSDNSVKNLKGDDRPINPVEDRACVLASLEMVDYVVIFDEPTPINLIDIIRPEYLVKGADYKGKKVVGEELSKELVLIDYINEKSTTQIINKIKK